MDPSCWVGCKCSDTTLCLGPMGPCCRAAMCYYILMAPAGRILNADLAKTFNWTSVWHLMAGGVAALALWALAEAVPPRSGRHTATEHVRTGRLSGEGRKGHLETSVCLLGPRVGNRLANSGRFGGLGRQQHRPLSLDSRLRNPLQGAPEEGRRGCCDRLQAE